MDNIAKLFGGKIEKSIRFVIVCVWYPAVETYWSRSMPRYENFRKALFFLSSVVCCQSLLPQYGLLGIAPYRLLLRRSFVILAQHPSTIDETHIFCVSHDCAQSPSMASEKGLMMKRSLETYEI